MLARTLQISDIFRAAMTYLLALDQGTSSTRSIVFDQQGNIVALAQKEIAQIYPEPGWGTSEEQECRIDSIAQSWSILSGAGDPERTERAIASARRHLVRDDDNIIRLLDPAFDRTPREPGYIDRK